MKMKIGIVGAESTGKSTLAKQLAEHFGGVCVPEYAREYVENLGRDYVFEDVETIARKQIQELTADYPADFVFFDTELIITKVWFLDKYGKVPEWFLQSMQDINPDFCLLCMPDLPFVDDPVRENGNRREELTAIYNKELLSSGIPFALVCGSGDSRLQTAISSIEALIK